MIFCMSDQITVGYDGSDTASDAVLWAAHEAVTRKMRDGDLLVLGSHGRGAGMAALLGSTVYSVLDHAAVPVVVVRA